MMLAPTLVLVLCQPALMLLVPALAQAEWHWF